jgi:WD40 repeat protein
MNATKSGAAMELEPPAASGPLPADVLAEMTDKCAELSATRRGRKPSPDVTTKDAMLGFAQKLQYTNHKSDKPGVTALAVCSSVEAPNSLLLLSGGMDKQVILTDGASGKAEAKIAAHSKKVTSVAFHPSYGANGSKTLFSSSIDGTVKVVIYLSMYQTAGAGLIMVWYHRCGRRTRVMGTVRHSASLLVQLPVRRLRRSPCIQRATSSHRPTQTVPGHYSTFVEMSSRIEQSYIVCRLLILPVPPTFVTLSTPMA